MSRDEARDDRRRGNGALARRGDARQRARERDVRRLFREIGLVTRRESRSSSCGSPSSSTGCGWSRTRRMAPDLAVTSGMSGRLGRDFRDRAGRGEARLRLPLRQRAVRRRSGARAATPTRGTARRAASGARHARRARADVREVRPAALDPARTSSRRTSSSSCAASRTRSPPFPYEDVRARGRGGARPDAGAAVPRLRPRSRSRPPRSARCTARRSRTGRASWSRCSGRTLRARSRPTSSSCTRSRASRIG